ncbi:MAG TPA: hypothetical protein VM123_07395 [archaeon]|nr:hypothetical protein [archaeon]
MKMRSLFLASLLILMSLNNLWPVRLDLVENSFFSRTDEPVTCGVPLAQGYAFSVDDLMLKSGITKVPVEIRAVSRWPDGSLRWIHLDFQATLEPSEWSSLVLEKGQREPVDSKLRIQENSEAITVTTGKIKVEVARRGFNVFNRVLLAGENGEYKQEIVAPHRRGLLAWTADQEYLAANDRSSQVEVEKRGPMRVVLRAEGNLLNDSGRRLFRFICRLYFYNDSPVVRLAYTFENRDPVVENKVALHGLHVEIPTLLAGERADFYIGKRSKDVRGPLSSPGAEAFVLAPLSTEYTFGGAAHGAPGGNAKRENTDRLGWIGLGSERGAACVGLRYFWQMYPSSLEVAHDGGVLKVGLIPRRLGSSVDIYSGVARTHYLRFAFTGKNDPLFMRSLVATCQKPLLAIAFPEYYCQETRAFGHLLPANPALFPQDCQKTAIQVDKEFQAGVDNMVEMAESNTVNGVTRESYGFLNWGDGVHYAWQPGVDLDRNIAWNQHYFDLPHISFIQFIRGGCRCWLYFFLAGAHHLMDMHVVHFDPNNNFNGRNRSCPGTDHVRLDPENPADLETAKVYVDPNQNHSKTQGLFDCWRLTGDERSYEVALKALRFARSFNAYGGFDQPQGAANQVLTMIDGYKITGDKDYLDTARRTFELWWDHARSSDPFFTGNFSQVGLLLEAFIDYYEISSDRRVVEFVKRAVEWMRANRPEDRFINMSLGIGFLAHELKDSQYLNLLKEYLDAWKGVCSNPFKDFALDGRNVARALYYLSNEALSH